MLVHLSSFNKTIPESGVCLLANKADNVDSPVDELKEEVVTDIRKQSPWKHLRADLVIPLSAKKVNVAGCTLCSR